MAYSKTIEDFFEKNMNRVDELNLLRSIVKEFPFDESIKWGMPSYGMDGKNIIGIGSFKNWSCLWFHQGCFLADSERKLVNAQEGKTSGMRQWRFKNIHEIDPKLVSEYLAESIQNHKDGKYISPKKKPPKKVEMPEILAEQLKSNSTFQQGFSNYSAAQQREFCNYINEAKRESTKLQRLEKITTLVGQGKKLASLWGG